MDSCHLVAWRRNGRTVDANRPDTTGCEVFRRVRSDRNVVPEEIPGLTPRRVSGLEQQSLAGAYPVLPEFFSSDDRAVPNHDDSCRPDSGVYRKRVNGPTADEEMEWRVDVCASVSAH
jgi:hypothetical protein